MLAALAIAGAAGGCAQERDPADYLPALATCLREAGWEAEMNEAGDGMSYDYGSADQRPAFEADKAACDQRLGTPPPPERLTDAQVRAQYQHLVDMRGCLLRLGHPTSGPPSEDAFVESWRAAERGVGDGQWSPYQDLPGPALEEVATMCPQAPANDN